MRNEKLWKMILTLAGVLLLVIAMRFLLMKNTVTLSDYAKEHPAQNPPSAADSDTEQEFPPAPSAEPLSPSPETDPAKAPSSAIESLPSAPETEPAAPDTPPVLLTGAALNASLPESERIVYQDGFYQEPLSDQLRRYITGISFPDTETAEISYEDLCYLHVLHYDFNGNPAQGELICNQKIASDLLQIFYELYQNEYQIEKILLIDEYDGDDTASMTDNNTSCFNYRPVEGSKNLSKHAYGLALDINPLYNPYITYPAGEGQKVSPENGAAYADRTRPFPYKIDENDLCYQLFRQYGFTWGGNWNSCKDYQHFQKVVK